MVQFRLKQELGPRRRMVAECLLSGITTDKAIAKHLGISPATVHAHMTALLQKFQCQDRAALVAKLFLARYEPSDI